MEAVTAVVMLVHPAHGWPAKLLSVGSTLLQVTGKGTAYADIPAETAPATKNTQEAWQRTKGGPHLIALSDPVCNGLQFSHGLFILEVVREGLCPLLQQLHNLGREGLQLGLDSGVMCKTPKSEGT